MPEHQAVNPEVNVPMIGIVLQLQLAEKEDALTPALVNVELELSVMLLTINQFAPALSEPVEIPELNADSLNALRIQTAQLEDHVFKTDVLMLAVWMEFVVPMLFAQSSVILPCVHANLDLLVTPQWAVLPFLPVLVKLNALPTSSAPLESARLPAPLSGTVWTTKSVSMRNVCPDVTRTTNVPSSMSAVEAFVH